MGAPARAARAWLVVASIATGALGACGPIAYVNQVSKTASNAVDEARAVNAAKFAPYEWTRAVEYLHQARVEAAAADFQAANRFGRLATAAAEQARTDAVRRAADPSLMKEITAPERMAPVGDDEAPPSTTPSASGMAPASGDEPGAP